MTFSDSLWQSTGSIYDAILRHPFNGELAAGVLPENKFEYYIQQDELYIKAYARALALLAAKAPSSDITNDLLSYAQDGILIERQLHDYFFEKFGITPTETTQPACFAYSNFLLATTSIEPFECGLAALLPCFWIYREVGHVIAQNSIPDNPYQLWIDTYTDADYDRVVDRVIEITNDVTSHSSERTLDKMRNLFIHSTRMEYQFWNAAYTLEKWPA